MIRLVITRLIRSKENLTQMHMHTRLIVGNISTFPTKLIGASYYYNLFHMTIQVAIINYNPL